jgi:hypothetical protein
MTIKNICSNCGHEKISHNAEGDLCLFVIGRTEYNTKRFCPCKKFQPENQTPEEDRINNGVDDTRDFCLSDKIETNGQDISFLEFLDAEDVQEFVRRLKAHFTPKEKIFYTYQMFTPKEFNKFIDKLAGEKLSK